MPNVEGPRRIPNHAVVAGSSWTIGRPLPYKLLDLRLFSGFCFQSNQQSYFDHCFISFDRFLRSRLALGFKRPEQRSNAQLLHDRFRYGFRRRGILACHQVAIGHSIGLPVISLRVLAAIFFQLVFC